VARTQPEIVERLGIEMDYTLISMYEHNKRPAPLNVLLAYARVTGVPLEQIVDDALELTWPKAGEAKQEEN
jgi:transcriptional regulator with XRE-family HTH domain